MKILARFAIVSLAAAGLLAAQPVAQGKTGPQKRKTVKSKLAPQTRGILRESDVQPMYESAGSDGVKIIVYKKKEDRWAAVDAGEKFRKGDKLRIAFTGNFEGYIYAVNVMPSGRKRVLFPYPGQANMVKKGEKYMWPKSEDEVYALDDEPGLEVIQIILSRYPIEVYDDAAKTQSGDLEESASNAAAELVAAGPKQEKGGFATDNIALDELKGYQTRSVKYAAGRNKNKGETVAVISNPDTETKDYKLKKNEAAVIELRLLHVPSSEK